MTRVARRPPSVRASSLAIISFAASTAPKPGERMPPTTGDPAFPCVFASVLVSAMTQGLALVQPPTILDLVFPCAMQGIKKYP